MRAEIYGCPGNAQRARGAFENYSRRFRCRLNLNIYVFIHR